MKKYDSAMMDTALLFAEQSHCNKLHVGAVAARDGRVLITGYNGTVPGTDNCCEEKTKCPSCDGMGDEWTPEPLSVVPCTNCNGEGFIYKTKNTTIHAEQNLVFYAARKGISLEGTTVYITHNPCEECAKAMAAAGVVEVVYKDFYKSYDGLNFLNDCNIPYRQYKG